MLVEMAVADAFGAGFEYARFKDPKEYSRRNNLKQYWPHPHHLDLAPGSYTDDTQMALALAEFMLAGTAPTPNNLADAFVRGFKQDPRPGYAGGFYKLLQTVGSGAELLLWIQPHSDKSGGAMRAPPYGLLPDLVEVRDRAMWQASLTHATKAGMDAAAASALMVHYFYRDIGSKEELGTWLDAVVPGGYTWGKWRGRVGEQGWQAVRAAVNAIQTRNTQAEILQRCVSYTGDVDTVAAISLAAASLSKEVAKDLPQVLVEGLENGTYGRSYLEKADRLLFQAFPAEGVNAPPPEQENDPDSGILELFGR